MNITRTMVANDFHIPWHCERNVELVLDIFEDLNLDRLILNGDILDFYNINMHGPKHPDIQKTLQDELDAGREFFHNLRKRFPKKHIVFNAGNHLFRLDRFILANAKPFWNILTADKYLNLKELNIEYYPYNNKYRIEKTNCFVQHSPPSYGINGAMTSLKKKLDQTYIYGCTHRVQHACLTSASGQIYSAYFNGWLGSTNATKEHEQIYSYTKGHENWQSAFCIVTVKNQKQFHVNQYLIKNHSVVVDGYYYEN